MKNTAYVRKQLGIKKYDINEQIYNALKVGMTHADTSKWPEVTTAYDTTICMYDYADIFYCLEKHPNGDNEDCRKCTEPCCLQSGINNV